MNPVLDKLRLEMDGPHWLVPFMDFVDDFRRNPDRSILTEPFHYSGDEKDALLASSLEYLCNEQGVEIPSWLWDIPPCKYPWFLSGMENLKAIAIVESPVWFRRRKIFVLRNFLDRV